MRILGPGKTALNETCISLIFILQSNQLKQISYLFHDEKTNEKTCHYKSLDDSANAFCTSAARAEILKRASIS